MGENIQILGKYKLRGEHLFDQYGRIINDPVLIGLAKAKQRLQRAEEDLPGDVAKSAMLWACDGNAEEVEKFYSKKYMEYQKAEDDYHGTLRVLGYKSKPKTPTKEEATQSLDNWKAWLQRDRTEEYEKWKDRNGVLDMPKGDCLSCAGDYDYHDEDQYSFDQMTGWYAREQGRD